MIDRLSPKRRSWLMSRIGSKDTLPELTVRHLLHSMGFRYRLHRSDLPGKPDIVFRSRKIVIFVHGCFWHQHPDPRCPLRSKPRSNTGYWDAKLERNVERDTENSARLGSLGWRTLTVWECEIRDSRRLSARLGTLLGPTS